MKRFKVMVVFILFLLFSAAVPVQAADQMQGVRLQESGQIIFLLDGSRSMSRERWQEALDCVLMVEAMLPSGYQAALAIYNTDVDMVVDFSQSMEDGILGLRDRKQEGYTDPGAALETALEVFAGELSGNKYVVLITDGEVSLPGAEETEAASASYQAAIAKAAEQGIIVDVLLYETEDIEDRVSDSVALTGGSCFQRTQERTAEDFGESYLFDRLSLERIMVGVSDSSDNLTKVSLQDTFADRVKILLLSENRLQDIQVSCQSRKISTVQGNHLAVITLEHPLEDTVELQYVLAEKGRMTAYLVKEYDLSVSAEASYIPETGCQQIWIRVVNSEGKDILEDTEVRDAIAIYIDGEKVPYEVSWGNAVITWFAESSGEIDLDVDFGGLNSRVYCDSSQSSLWLEVPLEEPVEDGVPHFSLYVVIAGVCVAFVVLLCLLKQFPKKETIEEGEEATPRLNEIIKYDFSGELVIYVLKTPDETDIPPASINLFARKNREPFSFEWIRSRCRIDYRLRDADKLLFSGGEDHTLCVRNKGDVTVVRSGEILFREKKYVLSYNDKLFLIFNDGEIEIEIYYKNMKPSERER